MQLFAVCLVRQGREAPYAGAALLAAAGATPQLDDATLTVGRSLSGRLSHARLSHDHAQAAPRRYAVERGSELVLFDGFPLEQDGAFAAHDAAVLLEHWDDLPHRLDGIFSALRIDLAADTVECVLDPLGLARVFVHRGADVLMVSNSVEAIRAHTGLAAVDELGVSSLLSLGYVVRERTLLAGVEPLSGGARHRFSATASSTERSFTPASVLATKPPREALAVRVVAAAKAAAHSGAALRSGLTSGRDTRVLLALLRATGVAEEVDFYTSGSDADLDVRVARQLARRFALSHRLLAPAAPAGAAWAEQTTRFVVRTDGVANLELVSDWVDHEEPVERVALEFWGGGGEVGRTNKHVLGPLVTMTPLLRRSHVTGERVLTRGLGDATGALRADTLDEARRHLVAFVERRRDEGWPAESLLEAYYAFEFLPARPGMGVRRAAASADLFSPFTTRAFVEHCLAVSAAERYLEHPHYTLIRQLAPEVDAVPYQFPWKPQRPALALVLAVDDARRRVGRRLRGTSPTAESTGPPFYIAWYEAGLEQHRDLVLSTATSPLWEFVDRPRYEALLRATPAEREPHVKALCRVLSAFWYLHASREPLHRDAVGSSTAKS